MTTAIIGLGRIGSRVAALLAAGGQEVVVADRDPAKAVALADSIRGANAAPSIDAAIDVAEVVIPAIFFSALPGFLADYGDALVGKTLIDPTNPVSFRDGPITRIIGENESGGETIAPLVPAGTGFAKAFGTLGAETLTTAANAEPRNALFYVTDDDRVAVITAELITAAGYAPVRAGGIDRSADIELQGALHQFGGAGGPLGEAAARKLVGG
ncbi:NADPH-dependent F420 reductase [Nocardia sp. SSK8]|uniref:NADPH-dependent F420 reductase n=1 Tax=Nocardia sp. SSK8 TaxID=3120154 RepID=UPI00300969EF